MLSVNSVESLFQSVMEAQTTLLSISPPKNTYKLCLPRAVQRLCRAGGTGQAGQAKTGPLFLHVMFGINRCTVMVVND